MRDSVAKRRRLCVELGLVRAPARSLWRLLGIWDDAPAGGREDELPTVAA